MNIIREIDTFYWNKEEPNKSCLFALRNIILEQDENITETLKYGMPCFCYRKEILCYLWIDKISKEPYLLMAKGKSLFHPELETGKRSRMKIFRINPNKNLPVKTIGTLLRQSLDLCRQGKINSTD